MFMITRVRLNTPSINSIRVVLCFMRKDMLLFYSVLFCSVSLSCYYCCAFQRHG